MLASPAPVVRGIPDPPRSPGRPAGHLMQDAVPAIALPAADHLFDRQAQAAGITETEHVRALHQHRHRPYSQHAPGYSPRLAQASLYRRIVLPILQGERYLQIGRQLAIYPPIKLEQVSVGRPVPADPPSAVRSSPPAAPDSQKIMRHCVLNRRPLAKHQQTASVSPLAGLPVAPPAAQTLQKTRSRPVREWMSGFSSRSICR